MLSAKHDRNELVRSIPWVGTEQPKEVPGPGTEFKKLVASLGVVAVCGSCHETLRWMNELGVGGCREQFDAIVAKIEHRLKSYSWWARIQAAEKALRLGLATKVNPLRPIPGLVEEAIRRAEH